MVFFSFFYKTKVNKKRIPRKVYKTSKLAFFSSCHKKGLIKNRFYFRFIS